MGDARGVQRDILQLLCPDLPDSVMERILPSRRSVLGMLTAQQGRRAQTSLQTIIPIEDMLFSGLVYELAAQDKTEAMQPVFLESF